MGKNTESDSYAKGFVFGALVGGIAGAVTALLLAPKSGAELRRDIADRSSDMYGKASDMYGDIEGSVSTAVSHTVNEGKAKAQDIIESAKQQADTILSSAEKVLSEAKGKAADTKGQVQEKLSQVKDAAKAGAETFKEEMKSTNI